MTNRTPSLYLEALKALEKDHNFILETQSKDPEKALRCYPRRPEDGRIDWHQSATTILRLINACNKPYAGAFCSYKEKPLIIWDAEVAPDENFMAIPGQIADIGETYVDVICGEGKLRIKEIEYEDKINSPASIFKSLRSRVK